MNEQMFKHEWVNVKKNKQIGLQYDQSTFYHAAAVWGVWSEWLIMKVARVLANPCRKDGQYFIIDTVEVYVVHV